MNHTIFLIANGQIFTLFMTGGGYGLFNIVYWIFSPFHRFTVSPSYRPFSGSVVPSGLGLFWGDPYPALKRLVITHIFFMKRELV